MPSPLDMTFSRSYSPVPPPCPSPQLNPLPLPTPPVYSRRPSLTQSSREHLPFNLKTKPSAESESLFYSLKDAIIVGNPGGRRHSDNDLRENTFVLAMHQRPRTAGVEGHYKPARSSSPTSPSFRRRHRRSDSIVQTQSPFLHPSRSLSRTRTRSPSGRAAPSEAPPPVPPLPSLKRRGNTKDVLEKKVPPIRIPELGLGLDDSLRSPSSPLSPSSVPRRRERASKESEASSFLHMTKHDGKRTSRVGLTGPLTGCLSMRTSHSLPDMKATKRRSNPSFPGRLLRLGVQQQVVH